MEWSDEYAASAITDISYHQGAHNPHLLWKQIHSSLMKLIGRGCGKWESCQSVGSKWGVGESEISEFEGDNSGVESGDSSCDLYALWCLDMAGLKSGIYFSINFYEVESKLLMIVILTQKEKFFQAIVSCDFKENSIVKMNTLR